MWIKILASCEKVYSVNKIEKNNHTESFNLHLYVVNIFWIREFNMIFQNDVIIC